jgi:hypothetical protein
MYNAHVWDLEDDPDGNLRHIAEHGFTQEDVEDVLFGVDSKTTRSRSTQRPVTFGYTSSGEYIGVVWEHIDEVL